MRELKDNANGYKSPYFEDYDSSGDSYSLAWRYLGVYIDDDGYSRKVLWAAVGTDILARYPVCAKVTVFAPFVADHLYQILMRVL